MLSEIQKLRVRAGLKPGSRTRENQAQTNASNARSGCTPNTQFGPLISSYLDACRARGLSAMTLKAYTGDLRTFLQFTGNGENPPTRDVFLAYKDHICHSRMAPSTRQRYLISVSAWCNWLVEEGKLETSPIRRKDVHIKRPRALPRNIRMEEVQKLLDTLYARRGHQALRDQAMFEILVCTGVRVGELVSLNAEDVDPSRGVVRVMGKGSRERIVVITDTKALKTIRKLLSRVMSGPLFLSRKGERISTHTVRDIMREILPHATPHQLRHTCATTLLADGVDIRFIQRLLGHSSIGVTERYAAVDDERLITVLREHNPRRHTR